MTLPGPSGAVTALMDRIYGRQRFIYDVTRRFYLVGRDRLIAGLDPGVGTVLEIGCGTGRNLIAVAHRFPHARLYGVDVSTAMLATAVGAIAKRGLSPRITVALADATALDTTALFDLPAVDRIVFSYTLCMIPDWQAAVRQAIVRLAPGGQIHIVEFGAWPAAPRWLRGALQAWLAAFHVRPISGVADALATLAENAGLRRCSTALAGGYAVLTVLSYTPP